MVIVVIRSSGCAGDGFGEPIEVSVVRSGDVDGKRCEFKLTPREIQEFWRRMQATVRTPIKFKPPYWVVITSDRGNIRSVGIGGTSVKDSGRTYRARGNPGAYLDEIASRHCPLTTLGALRTPTAIDSCAAWIDSNLARMDTVIGDALHPSSEGGESRCYFDGREPRKLQMTYFGHRGRTEQTVYLAERTIVKATWLSIGYDAHVLEGGRDVDSGVWVGYFFDESMIEARSRVVDTDRTPDAERLTYAGWHSDVHAYLRHFDSLRALGVRNVFDEYR